MIRRRSLWILAATVPTLGFASCLLAPILAGGQAVRPVVTPYRASGIYSAREKVGWTVTGSGGRYFYSIRRNNQTLLKSGEIDLASGKATIEVEGEGPGMLLMRVNPANSSQSWAFGAAVEPTQLKPVLPKPRDFDSFWSRKISELKAVPENPVVTPGESYKPEVDYATIRMDHVNGTKVYGQLAKPKKPGKYPAVLQLQWASPPYPLDRSWVIERAARGWLALNIEPHNVLPTEPPAYYQGLPSELKNYASIGMRDRERSYFVEMYLRDYRAVDYLSKLPEWNGKVLVVTGTSMGGQQSLCVAGLHGKITHVIVNEPAGCDLNAQTHGRQGGYPFFGNTDPKVLEVAQYVDAVNFAPNIRATSLVGIGFLDEAAPPAGIWTAFNLIRGPKEAAPMFDSPHNNLATPEQQAPINSRTEAWLDALAKGERVPLRKSK